MVFCREIDERGEAAVAAAAETFAVPDSIVAVGIRYCTAFPSGIDVWIEEARVASERAEGEWQRRQALSMTGPFRSEALLVDEMFSPMLADSLREDGFDVVAVAGRPVLAAAPDDRVARWAADQNRRILTENVRDFMPLLGGNDPPPRLLSTSSRRFPRSRNPGPLLQALRDWLLSGSERGPVEWLQ